MFKAKELNLSLYRQRPAVPRKPIKGIKEDPLSRKLRNLDNSEITLPDDLAQIYFNTNESNYEKTLDKLQKISKVSECCHIGFSGLFNFDIIAVRKSSRAVICDLNPENALFIHFILEILRECANREEFVLKTTQMIKERQYNYPHFNEDSLNFDLNCGNDSLYAGVREAHEEVALELKKSSGWLSSEENFQYLKELAMQDKIALITEDITASETFSKMAALLRDNGIQIDTVYVANIAHYIEEKDRPSFNQTIKKLMYDKDTLLIDAPKNAQRISQSRYIYNDDFNNLFFSGVVEVIKTKKPSLRVEQEQRRENSWCSFFKYVVIGTCATAIATTVVSELGL